jgi:RHS repeat-associated protein
MTRIYKYDKPAPHKTVGMFLSPQLTRISGKERDAESGLDYFGARYFSGPQGRFTSPDSTAYSKLGNPQSWNLYAYSFNNPLRFFDPTGNEVQAVNCGSEEECNKVRDGIRTALGNKEAASLVGLEKIKRGFLSGLWAKWKGEGDYRITISGDLGVFKALGENASRLADLVSSSQIITAQINDQYKQESGGWKETPGGIALTMVDPIRVTVHSDPSTYGKIDSMGYINNGPGRIPGASIGEAFAHELLGHTWSYLIGRSASSSFQFARDAVWAENIVRATDPSRGFKITHQGMTVMKMQDLEKLQKKQ